MHMKEVDIELTHSMRRMWGEAGPLVRSLGLFNVSMSEEDCMTLLARCPRLATLRIGSRRLFREGECVCVFACVHVYMYVFT